MLLPKSSSNWLDVQAVLLLIKPVFPVALGMRCWWLKNNLFWLLLACRDCAEKWFDLQAVPNRYFFELLSKFTKDDLEKEKFQEFTTTEGQQDLFDYCNRPRRSGLEVLADFSIHTVPNIPLEYLFDLFPVIKPRSFSIANSPPPQEGMMPGKIQLLVAIVKYKSVLVEPRLGLCSNYLANCNIGQKVAIWTKKGTLKVSPVLV